MTQNGVEFLTAKRQSFKLQFHYLKRFSINDIQDPN